MVEIGPVVLERTLSYERSQHIWLLISLLILYLNKIESPWPKNACFVQSPGEIYATRCMVKKKIMTTVIRLNSIWVSRLNIYSSEPKARYTNEEEVLNIYITYSPEASHFYCILKVFESFHWAWRRRFPSWRCIYTCT